MTRRPLVLALALLALAAGASTPAARAAAPTDLHPFLLRVDEPRSRTFSRTPAFAWNPVPGAQRYEFQLSTSSSFRDSGIVYADTSLTSPVAAPALTLPWISGTPHALYARVRAITMDGGTGWSAPYGFDMEPKAVPAPLPSYPGLLRWTPVDGAVAYQVWFVDVPKIITVTTNVADEREFYTFHQSASWLGKVRWRIRALRHDFNGRDNDLPAVGYGAWSPVYESVNPPFAVGPLKPAATVSDVVSTGGASAPAHKLTPGFAFGGNAPLAGEASELYRVHVFTDKRCINRVYSSSVVGGPAYAPRKSGPLSLPPTAAAIASARASFLGDTGEAGQDDVYSADGAKNVANESLKKVTATLGLPQGVAATPSGSGTAPAPTGGKKTETPVVELIEADKENFGPPVGLWDTDWENGGGYYWTVVGVEAKVPDPAKSTLAAGTAIGATTLVVANASSFVNGDTLKLGNAGNEEVAVITTVTGNTITVASPLKLGHGPGEPLVRTNGNIRYRETELAQDTCAAGRILRFGKESEPSLTAGGDAFASGLTPRGKLASAQDVPSFYGAPLVAWTTALGAEVYAVQWSRSAKPFKAETDPATGAIGMMTLNTSAVLPLEPGTWFYRVRGYDYSLPQKAQAMSWSDPQRIVVTRPTFAVVGESASDKSMAGTRTLSSRSAGVSLKLPSSFRSGGRATAAASAPTFRPAGPRGSRLRLAAFEAGRAAFFLQTSPDRSARSHEGWLRNAFAAARRAGVPRCARVALPAAAGARCAGKIGGRPVVLYLLQHRTATYALTFAGTDRGRFAAAARSLRFAR